MEMEQPISDADSANLGSKWGAAVKAMSTDPMAQKIVYEVEAAGCCYPPFMCMIDKNVVKYAKERSYTWVLEGGIEKNMYAPQVVCGCISLQALCPCCGCPGKDNIEKYYFDHAPFMGPKTGFATEKDINWCCYIPFLFEGVPCDCCDKCCTTPCYGGSVMLVNPMGPCCKPCCTQEEYFKYATRCGPCPCGGPACCTHPLLIFVKDSNAVKHSLTNALRDSLERQKTTYVAPAGAPGAYAAAAPTVDKISRE